MYYFYCILFFILYLQIHQNAPTLASRMRRHNYDISRNEYLTFILSEPTISLVY